MSDIHFELFKFMNEHGDIKNHEREEIPDEVWDICMELIDLIEVVIGDA